MPAADHDLPPLKALIAFEATVRLGSMTAAARELGISQPAVSQRLRVLEEQIGAPLTQRSGQKVVATAVGESLFNDIADSVREVEAAVHRARQLAHNPEARLTLTAHFGFTYQWLLPRLPQLEAAFPGVRFEVIPEDDEQRLAGQRADISFTFGQLDGRSRYERLLIPEVVFAVCSPALAERLGLGATLDPAAFAQLPLLHKDVGDARWLDWRQWCRLAGFAPPPRHRFSYSNYPLLLGAAEAGQGIALGWIGLHDEALAAGRLVALQPAVRRKDYGYILRAQYPQTALVAQVLRWLEAEAAKPHLPGWACS
jgi:DNA-binding transcriptional LysR family regulator